MVSTASVAPSRAWSGPRAAQRPQGQERPYLFGRVRDLLLLGGISLLLLPVALLLPESAESALVWVFLGVGFFVNYPHFAHSYQLFYRGFGRKIDREAPDRVLRARYLVTGTVIPVVLGLGLGGAIASGDEAALGLAGNVMAFFVGWHYVKQGYGMLIVDSVRAGRTFSKGQRHVLLANAYAVWALTWIALNTGAAEEDLFGVAWTALSLPGAVQVGAAAVAALTGLGMGAVLVRRWSGGGLPINGLTAYLVTLYLWMVFVSIDPIWILVVPSLHSLQYLVVVWRFELNRTQAGPDASTPAPGGFDRRLFGTVQRVRFSRFVFSGILLGAAGFWLLPLLLEISIPMGAGGQVFLFAFWVFINVHHYFIDSVIWRSGNAEVGRYLFGAGREGSRPIEAAAA